MAYAHLGVHRRSQLDIERARLRLSPLLSREAPGSPARLSEVWRNRSLSKATLRLRLKSTARPS
jgi:hypothetical protein